MLTACCLLPFGLAGERPAGHDVPPVRAGPPPRRATYITSSAGLLSLVPQPRRRRRRRLAPCVLPRAMCIATEHSSAVATLCSVGLRIMELPRYMCCPPSPSLPLKPTCRPPPSRTAGTAVQRNDLSRLMMQITHRHGAPQRLGPAGCWPQRPSPSSCWARLARPCSGQAASEKHCVATTSHCISVVHLPPHDHEAKRCQSSLPPLSVR